MKAYTNLGKANTTLMGGKVVKPFSNNFNPNEKEQVWKTISYYINDIDESVDDPKAVKEAERKKCKQALDFISDPKNKKNSQFLNYKKDASDCTERRKNANHNAIKMLADLPATGQPWRNNNLYREQVSLALHQKRSGDWLPVSYILDFDDNNKDQYELKKNNIDTTNKKLENADSRTRQRSTLEKIICIY